MSDKLTPGKVYNDLTNGITSKKEASELLMTLIENSDYYAARIEGLEILRKISLKSVI